jgi:hypothetical protein
MENMPLAARQRLPGHAFGADEIVSEIATEAPEAMPVPAANPSRTHVTAIQTVGEGPLESRKTRSF